MKLTNFFSILVALVLLIIGCSGGGSQSEVPESEEEATSSVDTVDAVCIWDNISVRSTPSADGKWLTSISVGESIKYFGQDSLDVKDKKRIYSQVVLGDGTIGWSLKDFIIPNGKVAVFLEENLLYKRPDLLTKTDKSFEQMDIVAIKSTQDEWLEVVGRKAGADWIQTGWVKGGNLSSSSIDVAVAKFGSQALSEKDVDKRQEKINEILANSDFSGSKFIPLLQEMLDASTEELGTEEVDSLNSDAVESVVETSEEI